MIRSYPAFLYKFAAFIALHSAPCTAIANQSSGQHAFWPPAKLISFFSLKFSPPFHFFFFHLWLLFLSPGRHGFIVSVVSIDDMSEGLVLAGRGEVLFHVKYKAIVFRPIRGEVVDAIVKSVSKVWQRVKSQAC